MPKSPAAKPGEHQGGYQDRFWIPRIWDGMNFSALVRHLAQNRFRVGPTRIAMASIAAGIGLCVHAPLEALQFLVYGRRIRRTEIEQPPIFIVGHWRSGTTLLHELMILDERHPYANTYACFSPNHYLLTKSVLPGMVKILMPKCRPQDNMLFGWKRPQEDEFALCNLGVPSPYLMLMFPNDPPLYQEYLDMQGVSAEDLDRWKQGLLWFLKCLTVESPKRIVLKSPPHTARIRVLLELFPGARFVHIYRDPYAVFTSTMNLWKRLARDEGLQKPRHEGLEEYVFETFNRVYRALERDRELIPPGRFCEVSYESLVADQIGEVERIYEELELGEFDRVLPRLREFVAGQADYKPNRYNIAPELRGEIARRWAPFIEKYGYESAAAEIRDPHAAHFRPSALKPPPASSFP